MPLPTRLISLTIRRKADELSSFDNLAIRRKADERSSFDNLIFVGGGTGGDRPLSKTIS